MTTKLGKTQQEVFKALVDHREWYPACGWIWDTYSGTIRVLDALVRKGVVTKEPFQTRISGNVWKYRPVVK